MNGIFCIFLGAIIVFIALFYMKKEMKKIIVEKSFRFNGVSDENVREILEHLETVEDDLDKMNESYYEIVNDLEGKYSVHEKEIEILQNEFENMEEIQKIEDIKKMCEMLIENKLNDHLKNHGEGKSENEVSTDITKEISVPTQSSLEGLSKREKIYKLSKNGLGINQIARELDLGTGEIKLILNLQD